MAYDKSVDSAALDAGLTAIADAIREKGGTTESLSFPDGMEAAVYAIEAGGGSDDVAEAIVTKTITEYRNENITTIGDQVFRLCNKLETVHAPNVTKIGASAFHGCSALKSADFPLATSVGGSGFYGCSAMTYVNLPKATSFGTYTFLQCYGLIDVCFPACVTVENTAFYNCTYLERADFPVCTSIDTQAFRGNVLLTALILRSETMCELKNTNAFLNCYHFTGTVHSRYNPDGLQDGYFYVPAALVASYQTATNWSTYSTQFRALEDYTVDGTITGALDDTKI